MLKESDILYQKGNFWICKEKKGYFTVYQDTITHAKAIAAFEGKDALAIAKCYCDYKSET